MTSEFTDPPLDDLRRSFEDLGLQQKAEFLVEATFKTFAAGVEKAGTALSRELDGLFAAMEREAPAEPSTDVPPPRPADEAAPGAADGASPPPRKPRPPEAPL